MALVGDKVKLTNYKYKLSSDGKSITTNSTGTRTDNEKVVDAFDVDWRPYVLTYDADLSNIKESYALYGSYQLINWLGAAYSYCLQSNTCGGHYSVEHVSQGITYQSGMVITSVEADPNGHLNTYTYTIISNSSIDKQNDDPIISTSYDRVITNVNLLSNLELSYTYHDIYYPIDGTDGNSSQSDKIDRITGIVGHEFISGIKREKDGTISYTYETIGTTFSQLINDSTDDYSKYVEHPEEMSYTFNTNKSYLLSYACIKQDGTGSYTLSTEVATGIEQSVALGKYILTINVDHGELGFTCYRSMEVVRIEITDGTNTWIGVDEEYLDTDEKYGITNESGKTTVITTFGSIAPVESESEIVINSEKVTVAGGPSVQMAMFTKTDKSGGNILTYTCRDSSTDYTTSAWTTNPIYQYIKDSVKEYPPVESVKGTTLTIGGNTYKAINSRYVDFYCMGQDTKQKITDSNTTNYIRLKWMLKVYYGINADYASQGNNDSQFIQYSTSDIFKYNEDTNITFDLSSNKYYVFVPKELALDTHTPAQPRDLKFSWNGGIYEVPADSDADGNYKTFYLKNDTTSIPYIRYYLDEGVTPEDAKTVTLIGYYENVY